MSRSISSLCSTITSLTTGTKSITHLSLPAMTPSLPFPIVETKNYYSIPQQSSSSGSTQSELSQLNRLSWLRTDPNFLKSAFHHNNAKFLPFWGLKPLVRVTQDNSGGGGRGSKVEWVSLKEVESLWANDNNTNDSENNGGGIDQLWHGIDGKESPNMVRGQEAEERQNSTPVLIFLGVTTSGDGEGEKDTTSVGVGNNEASRLLPEKPASKTTTEDSSDQEKGTSLSPSSTPRWAISLSPPSSSYLPSSQFSSTYSAFLSRLDITREKLISQEHQPSRDFLDPRIRPSGAAGALGLLDWEAASMVAMGRTLIDWHERNRFCPSCSRPTRSIWAGWKRACVPDSIPYHYTTNTKKDNGDGENVGGGTGGGTAGGRPPCITSKGIHNFQYPRSDPVVIMAILDHTREKILLGRQKSWPTKFYSCLAGFLEPGESLEDAVRREVWEEAGVKVNQVFYHSSQPWPFPGSLMVGCVGVADEEVNIRTDLDNELDDARFIPRSTLLPLFNTPTPLSNQISLSRQDIERIDSGGGQPQQREDDKNEGEDEMRDIRMPPSTAIAHQLIKWFVTGSNSNNTENDEVKKGRM